MNTRKLLTIARFSFCLLALAASAAAQAKQPVPIPTKTTELHWKSARGVLYCEVWLVAGTPETGLRVVYYNTWGFNNSANKMDTCPGDMWAKINVDELKAKYDILTAFKNGPRGLTIDSALAPAGQPVDFNGLKARWYGQALIPKGANFESGLAAYKPVQSHRKTTMTFEKGKPVFVLDDPEGTPWVMQAWSQIVDPDLTYDKLKDLGSKLKLPDGWKFRVATLDQDLVLSTPQGYNWITQDDLQNTYDACKDNACNFKP